MKRFHLHIFVILLLPTLLFPQARTYVDWKWHNVGKILQLITNVGYNANNPVLNLPTGLMHCEYPIGSGNYYSYENESGAGNLIGSIVGSRKLVSSACDPGFEFFPTDELWDRIFVVGRGDTVDIPYWPNYVGISDQDFVCRYSDYHGFSAKWEGHEPHLYPQYIDIIQTSHAWSIPPYDEMILYQFYIIPTKNDLHDAYIGYWWRARLGHGFTVTGFDDCNKYYPDLNLMEIYDTDKEPSDDGLIGPAGRIVFPPENIDPNSYTTVFSNVYDIQAKPDEVIYDWLAAERNYESSCDVLSIRPWPQVLLRFGPFELKVGDTLHYMVGEIQGVGEEGMLENVNYMIKLKESGFKTPGPPPSPKVRASIKNHQAILRWDPQPGDKNPEVWIDSTRLDVEVEPQPFEGYRVYKSTESKTGPWTLLAEYDIAGNAFFGNTGLQYEYTDQGLVNNLEYYYAVSSFSKPDVVSEQKSIESNMNLSAVVVTPGTAAPTSVTDEIAVIPNPYRGDIAYQNYKPAWEVVPAGHSWHEIDRRIQFINIPSPCEIKIYSLAGDLITTLQHDNPNRGFVDWNLTSTIGQTIASGIYLFTVEDTKNGDIHVGKFVVIK
jgi:hypothetical protein